MILAGDQHRDVARQGAPGLVAEATVPSRTMLRMRCAITHLVKARRGLLLLLNAEPGRSREGQQFSRQRRPLCLNEKLSARIISTLADST
jgi:hypothetical protein